MVPSKENRKVPPPAAVTVMVPSFAPGQEAGVATGGGIVNTGPCGTNTEIRLEVQPVDKLVIRIV